MTIPDDIPVDVNGVSDDIYDVKFKDVTSAERGVTSEKVTSSVIYGVDDVPPWYLCILLGFQVSCLTIINPLFNAFSTRL